MRAREIQGIFKGARFVLLSAKIQQLLTRGLFNLYFGSVWFAEFYSVLYCFNWISFTIIHMKIQVEIGFFGVGFKLGFSVWFNSLRFFFMVKN